MLGSFVWKTDDITHLWRSGSRVLLYLLKLLQSMLTINLRKLVRLEISNGDHVSLVLLNCWGIVLMLLRSDLCNSARVLRVLG